jgi:hypothetical protein
MTEQAFFTVGEAAKAARRSKATISNAIKTGRLSVHERAESGYKIAASELFRVFQDSVHRTARRRRSSSWQRLV